MKTLKKEALFPVIALVFALLLAGCAGSSGKAPVWMTDLEKAYPDAQYLAAVGTGDSRQGAQEAASGVLAQVFRVQVNVDLVSQERYLDLVKGDSTYSESEKNIVQTIGTQASEQFVNLRYSDPYTDAAGRVHVVAYLERLPTATVYRTIIGKDLQKIDDLMERASGMTGSLQRFAFYDAAHSVGQNVERMIAQLHIIHSASARIAEMGLDLRPAADARDRELAALNYDMRLAGDDSGRLAGLIRNVLAPLSLSYKAGGILTVTGTWSLEPVTVNPQFKSVRWTADVSILDERGVRVAGVTVGARENAISEPEAEAFAWREAEKQLGSQLRQSLQGYLTRIVTGN